MPKKKRDPRPSANKQNGLNAKQREFCRQWCVDKNGTRAAIEAGYSKRSAHAQATALLKNPKVKAYCDQVLARVAKKTEITIERVLEEYAKIAFFDIKSVVDSYNECGVTFKSMDQIDGHCIASIEEVHVKDGSSFVRMKPWNKMDALRALKEHLTPQTPPVTNPLLEMVAAKFAKELEK